MDRTEDQERACGLGARVAFLTAGKDWKAFVARALVKKAREGQRVEGVRVDRKQYD